MFSERPHWCQGRHLITFPGRSETVMMWSSLKGWGRYLEDLNRTFRTFWER